MICKVHLGMLISSSCAPYASPRQLRKQQLQFQKIIGKVAVDWSWANGSLLLASCLHAVSWRDALLTKLCIGSVCSLSRSCRHGAGGADAHANVAVLQYRLDMLHSICW
jgi:hypothetical protein